jgi:uncharacterized RDD family membrane protein YckC
MIIATKQDRFFGALIDYLLWIVLTLIAYYIFYKTQSRIIAILIAFVPFLLKDITGQSPGKKILKTKIVKNGTDEKPNILFLFLRPLFYFILIIDVPFIFCNVKNKRLADYLFKTVVVKL